MALRKVINALITKQKQGSIGIGSHVPYRDSKLTAILRQSLGGNSLSLFIACLAPGDDNYEENISTLKYATRASRLVNIASKSKS